MKHCTSGGMLLALALLPLSLLAQPDEEQDTESLSLLLTPPAPGFVLLGIEPTSVERPGSVADLTVTILNQTDDLSILPSDFALEVAPFWLLGGEDLTYEAYAGTDNLLATILQSASFSVATTSNAETSPDPTSTSLGFGFRCSLLRGSIDPTFANYAQKLDSLWEAMERVHMDIAQTFGQRLQQDSTYQRLLRQARQADPPLKSLLEAQMAARQAVIQNEVEHEIRTARHGELTRIRNLATSLQVRRLGWKLDLAGGVAVDFPARDFDRGSLTRAGAWVTSGYEGRRFGFLAVGRFLGDRQVSENSAIDVGGRVVYDGREKFSLSVEGVYRRFPERKVGDEDTWRLAFLFNYYVAKNRALAFTFGRDFEGQQTGNLISLVNFMIGFGSKRPLK